MMMMMTMTMTMMMMTLTMMTMTMTHRYDCSTDDDSLRLIFSETDHSACCRWAHCILQNCVKSPSQRLNISISLACVNKNA